MFVRLFFVFFQRFVEPLNPLNPYVAGSHEFRAVHLFDCLFICTYVRSNCLWLRHWIPNPGFPSSKPLCGSKFDSALHPSEVQPLHPSDVDKMRPGMPGKLVVRNKFSLHSGFVVSRQLNPIHKKAAIKFNCIRTRFSWNGPLDFFDIVHVS